MDEDVGGLEGMKARGEGCLKEEACGWKGGGDQHRREKERESERERMNIATHMFNFWWIGIRHMPRYNRT